MTSSNAVPPSSSASGAAGPAGRWPLALAAILGLYYGLALCFQAVPTHLGLGMQDGWFLDMHALLAAGEAAVRGIPVDRFNPLDIYHRPHSYSNWWLVMGDWGLDRGDTLWLGLLLLVAFLAVAIVQVRPRATRDLAWSAAVLCAPPVQLCLLRANNDAIVYLALAALVPCLTGKSSAVRLLAAFLVAFAAGLKYYPAVAGLLLLWDRSPRLLVWRLVAFCFLGVLVLLGVYEDTLHFATSLPAPAGLFTFGAGRGLAALGLGASVWRAVALLAVAALAVVTVRPAPARSVPRAGEARELQFVLGAVLLVACFWTEMNWGYRWVFAIWLLPALLRPAGEPGWILPRERRVLLALLPICLWWDGACSLFWNFGPGKALGVTLDRYSESAWLVVQPVHWTVFALLAMVCVRFAWGTLRQDGRLVLDSLRTGRSR